MAIDDQLINELLIHAEPDVEVTVLQMAHDLTKDLDKKGGKATEPDWLPELTDRVTRLLDKCKLLAKCRKAREARTTVPAEFKAGERNPKVEHLLVNGASDE